MQIFMVNFYEPSRFFNFWSDDFIMAIARFWVYTLGLSLLVKYKTSVSQFSDFAFFNKLYTKMVNNFCDRTVTQGGPEHF